VSGAEDHANIATDASPHAVFRPDHFFLGDWHGWGVARDPFGRVRRRFSIQGSGKTDDHSRRAVVHQAFTFDDGHVERQVWEVSTDDQGYFISREQISGMLANGRQSGRDYLLDANVLAALPIGKRRLRLTARYTLAEPNVAFSFTSVKRFGLRISAVTACYIKAALAA
jgi:hypothetical protein